MSEELRYDHLVCVKNKETIVSLDHLSVHKGDIYGIMGANGAGKSTLLQAMALLDPPAEGSVVFQGNSLPIEKPPLAVRRRWACVFQQAHRFVGSVYDNAALGLKLRKIPKNVVRERVMHWLETFRIGHLAGQNAGSLSGGEAQRMNLARAFALEPDVLFLDEPFSALDFPTKIALLRDLQTILNETKQTTFLVSHDLTDVEMLASHLMFIQNGTVHQTGRLHDVFHAPSKELKGFLQPWRTARSAELHTLEESTPKDR
ncbi:ATP-binding cassette domain-containing protein [Salisediminibacterium halotolerans]|uniref:ATP-binding cassette domain-containing protein n=1 Tax=Salisediminibacterium halotolerans TaxID=517425 RepID=UPI000EACF738|nr:ATP-binding cassette domain-containing protein [Salisediminibacterium halotolerans]RLJ73242.1 carbohydrate ABC transporter ATP-binding protein (CUT1 family) [Actinophytocola xinjiangensis]RPE86664.1 tungstate transport system ATP-binding protein [Salisediminibacterium halotolerans]TWG34039.1 carbohydrate ABC transporter ATP-binding protein (CUT1 family) [Salisediminibacterium halotolerans]GEL08304.1 hypothetical protein SHA02_17200 [Salisediminibacterium halotolerans]